jgi:methionyl-tRNA formyltransferase
MPPNAIRAEGAKPCDDKMEGMRSVFMGSPEYALPSLEILARLTRVAGVVTQPDRPAGRGRTLVPPPVKMTALKLGLPVIQPETLRSPETMEQLKAWAPEIIVVAAFGKLLRPEVLSLPERGCVNLHASLLPRHRGAAPIPAAILAGDPETGITLMQMDPGLDTGPVLAQKRAPIRPEDTSESLTRILGQLAAETLSEYLPVYIRGELTARPQDNSQATYAPQLTKADGKLDFRQPADALHRRVRALHPWPGAYIPWKGKPLKIIETHPEEYQGELPPGALVVRLGFPAVRVSDGMLVLRKVQPAGKRIMTGDEFLRGAKDFTGRLGE